MPSAPNSPIRKKQKNVLVQKLWSGMSAVIHNWFCAIQICHVILTTRKDDKMANNLQMEIGYNTICGRIKMLKMLSPHTYLHQIRQNREYILGSYIEIKKLSKKNVEYHLVTRKLKQVENQIVNDDRRKNGWQALFSSKLTIDQTKISLIPMLASNTVRTEIVELDSTPWYRGYTCVAVKQVLFNSSSTVYLRAFHSFPEDYVYLPRESSIVAYLHLLLYWHCTDVLPYWLDPRCTRDILSISDDYFDDKFLDILICSHMHDCENVICVKLCTSRKRDSDFFVLSL
ncbi:hypothetical protein AGLY_005873 [Aphis glycines]|uniref:Uncharacterized protein n=1 Tax=Aphis glycines TaxID=307491 RepID=A0A6G0TS37_APHGL|nr:hypothetical protein AGLY_005873 [Aphis glycines]